MKRFEVKVIATLVFPNVEAEQKDAAIVKVLNKLPKTLENGAGVLCGINVDDVMADCYDLMDTTNNHDAGLAERINKAWDEKNKDFISVVDFLADFYNEQDILALRDARKRCHDFCQYVADDEDLKTILSHCRM